MPSLSGKILAIILYMIPWSDSLYFGNHLFIKYPFFQIIQIPAIPIIIIAVAILSFFGWFLKLDSNLASMLSG